MTGRMTLGYLVFEVTRIDRWRRFADAVFGAGERPSAADGGFAIRLDQATHRLVIQPGRRDDISAIGFELADGAALAELANRLTARGIALEPATEAMLQARRVRQLVACDDPAGNRLEFTVGLEQVAAPCAAPAFPGGFHTGTTGFGHAVLAATDLAPMEAFYVDTLGMQVTERLDTKLGPLQVRGTFLHCNRRHHSLALMTLPVPTRLHHFMLEANAISDVGRAFERVKAAGIPLSLGLGQHPDPDGTLSFYGATPSGFDFEIGAGGREIEPEDWREGRNDTASSWGHAPTLRLRLAMARGMITRRFRSAA